jgi:hypothetical protein
MSTLSPKGCALVRAGRRVLRPTDADRVRLLGALNFRLEALPCRPTWDRCRLRSPRAESRWRSRALPDGATAREGMETLPGFPYHSRWRSRALPDGATAREGMETLPGFPYHSRWRSRALPDGATAREGMETLPGFPYQRSGRIFRRLGSESASSARSRRSRGAQTRRTR